MAAAVTTVIAGLVLYGADPRATGLLALFAIAAVVYGVLQVYRERHDLYEKG